MRTMVKRCVSVVLTLAVACGREGGEAEIGAEGDEGSTRAVAQVDLPQAVYERHGVRVEAARKEVLTPTFLVPAQVAFNSEGIAHVGIPVRGRVDQVRVKIGDLVERGQELLTVESAELGEAQGEYLVKRTAARTSAPAVELARSAHERARALFEKDQGISLAEVQEREAGLRLAEAARIGAESEARAARDRLRLVGMSDEAIERLASSERMEPSFAVRAPIAGRVIERHVAVGEFVGPERDALFVLADMQRLWVLADVPGGHLNELAEGARARVLFGTEEGHWCNGVVSFLSPALDPATRSVRVRIEPEESHPDLRPGIFAQAEIESALADHEPVVAVPEGATQTVEGETVVFVPVEGLVRTFRPRAVRSGPPVLGRVPVLEGLAEGELYVSEGSFLLKAELLKSTVEEEE